MFICGDDADAKKEVSGILDRFGFEAEDLGGVQAARAIEPLCILVVHSRVPAERMEAHLQAPETIEPQRGAF
jgi:predicted dinucleotide-binding enzyme